MLSQNTDLIIMIITQVKLMKSFFLKQHQKLITYFLNLVLAEIDFKIT
jgi:hypothetical protein